MIFVAVARMLNVEELELARRTIVAKFETQRHEPAGKSRSAHRIVSLSIAKVAISMAKTLPSAMRIPYLDLTAQHAPIRDELMNAIGAIIDRNAFVLGPGVDAFEYRFAEFCGAKHCVAVNTGTAALHLALLAAGVGSGDEVITQADTFIATVAAIMYTGARPVLVDVLPPTYTIDIAAVEAAITPRTKAILPVHLFGQPCDLDALRALAEKNALLLIEDASQAHGARYKGNMIGATGKETISFYPGKNLGACGEGGAVVTDDSGLADQVRLLRNHGSKEKYRHTSSASIFGSRGFKAPCST